MEKALRYILLLVCASLLVGLGRLHLFRAPPTEPLPALGFPLDDALRLAGIDASSAVLLVLDQRCSACRARHAELHHVVRAADSAGIPAFVIAIGHTPIDSTYYRQIIPLEQVVVDGRGNITRSLNVRAVPAVLVSNDRNTAYASVPTSADWPDWELFRKALGS